MAFRFGNRLAGIDPLLEHVQWSVWSGILMAGEIGKHRDGSFKKATAVETGGCSGGCRMTRGNRRVD